MWLFYTILVLVILVLLLGFIAPKSYSVSRSAIISKPLAEVYNYLKYLKNQDDWSPWMQRDANIKKSYSGIDGEPGFISRWEGNKEVGSGEQELIALEDNTRIDSELRFIKPFKSTSDAFMKVERADENATKVTWGFSGHSKFPLNIIYLFMNLDKMVGKDFEEGLINLKKKLEA